MAQRVHETIEVQAPLWDVFRYWSNFENFARIVERGELGGPGAQTPSR